MKKKSDINKIKNSFEQINKTAPDFIWDKIASNLESKPEFSQLDEKVKHSFETISKKPKPDVWKNIERQLIIDNVWLNIRKTLNRDVFIIRILKTVAVFLLFLFLTYYFDNPLTNKNTNRITIHKKEENTFKQAELRAKNLNTNDTSKKFNKPKIKLKQENTINSKSDDLLPQNTALLSVNYSSDESDNYTVDEKISSNSLKNTNTQKNITVNSDSTTNNYLILNSNSYKDNTSLLSHIELEKIEAANFNSDIKTISQNYKTGWFELGLSSTLYSTDIINNDYKLGENGYSLVKHEYDYSVTFAISGSYYFNDKNSLNASYVINDVAKQKIKKFENGALNKYLLQLKYYKFELYYKYNVLLKSVPLTKFTAGLGGYYSYLASADGYINNVHFSTKGLYNNYDYGVVGILGLRNEVKMFVFEYGLIVEYGFPNIFSGNQKINAALNNTHIFHKGVFLKIKAIINK